jgi:hypothetical protein
VIGHLLAVPAGADAEQEASARDVVERRHLLGESDRVALDDEADAGADQEPLGRRGGRSERDEGVEEAVIPARKLFAAGPRRAPARGDVGVLREEERLEAALLGGTG